MNQYNVNSISVGSILGQITSGIIAIPEIQRPFVWDSTKVRDLIDSLYKGYPVGYIITWKSHDVKLKDGTSSMGKQILIDGQQRITALSASLLGKSILDDSYKRKKITISFNLKTEEFQTKTPATEKSEEWITDISEFITPGKVNIWEFVQNYSEKFGLDANTINTRISKLQAIQNTPIGCIDLGPELDINTVTEIFVRINSKGQPLSQADFAMSKISVNETYEGNDIRKTIDYFCHLLQEPNDYNNIIESDTEFVNKDYFRKLSWIKDNGQVIYKPDYTDILRVAFTYKFKRGKLENLVSLLSGRDFEAKEYNEETIQKTFETLKDGVLQFINQINFERYIMILESAGIIDSELVRSQNVMNFGYILYLFLREKGIQPEKIERHVRRWIIMSIISQRYTSSPESQFDYDIRRLTENEDVEQYIEEELGREMSENFFENILPERFNTPVASSPFWKTFLIAQIKLNARGFLSRDITVRSLIEQRGDVHHIFPKYYLKKNGKDNKQTYNQIANFAMLQTEVNIQVGNKAPNVYMEEVFKQCQTKNTTYGGITEESDLIANMKENCIPLSFKDMTVYDYEEFLKQRQKLMAAKVKEYYYSL